jgi:hypothetical protein
MIDPVLQPILDFYKIHGKPPGKRDITPGAILWKYKSWAKAIEAAGQNTMPRIPKLDQFIYTIMIYPAPPSDAMIAGEIELYIYDAIRRGLETKNKIQPCKRKRRF